MEWIRDLLGGRYDAGYVARRWRVGWRHVEIGLEQVYTNVALSRLRKGLISALHEHWSGDHSTLNETVQALNKLLDLDLAIIEDAYQDEYAARLQRTERLATLGQIAGGVAHELRNPLNVIKTSVYYLRSARNPTPEKQSDHLRRIERNVEVADNVISSLSNFAKIPIPVSASRSPSSRSYAKHSKSTRRVTVSRSRLSAPPVCPTRWVTGTSFGSRSAT